MFSSNEMKDVAKVLKRMIRPERKQTYFALIHCSPSGEKLLLLKRGKSELVQRKILQSYSLKAGRMRV